MATSLLATRQWTRRAPAVLLTRLATAVVAVLVTGCQGDGLKPGTNTDERTLYWRLELDQHAALMSVKPPYDTLTIKATPRNVQGGALLDLPAPTYTSSDPEHVGVTADGVVQARGVTTGEVMVVASLAAGNVRHVDTLWVTVDDNQDPPVLDSFSAHPVPPDSAKVPVGGYGSFMNFCPQVRATDVNGNVISNVPLYLTASDPTMATWARIPPFVCFVPMVPGPITLYVSTTVYGVQKADTVPYRFGWSVFATVYVKSFPRPFQADSIGFEPNKVYLGVGGIIRFQGSADVAFTDKDVANVAAVETSPLLNLPFPPYFFPISFICTFSSCADSGNGVAPLVRVLTAPGTYEYRSTVHNTAGTIVVVDERE